MTDRKSPEEYRQLAEKCRETARTVSTERDRADLLSMAKIWDFLADCLRLHRSALNK
jgi:hypothetical protein